MNFSLLTGFQNSALKQESQKDDEDIQQLIELLQEELSKLPAEAEFEERYLSKKFMLMLNKTSHKYQLLAQQIVKNQQEYRRHQALQTKDDFAYLQAVQETTGRKIKVATEIEDNIFDYFCIISI